MIDRWLRPLILASSFIFACASLALGLAVREPAVVFIGVAVWGITFGGCATLFQTGLAIAAGDAVDVAQSLLVVTWNSSNAAGGVLGGILLNRAGAGSLPWTLFPLLIVSFVIAFRAKRF